MQEEYSIEEKVHNKEGKYVPVSIKIHKYNDPKYNENAYPWNKLWIDRPVRKGQVVYVVTYIQHSGEDHGSNAFFKESDARKYIEALGRAISYKNKINSVEVHYNSGLQNLNDVLNIPVNTYINFRTPLNEYSVTFAKTTY